MKRFIIFLAIFATLTLSLGLVLYNDRTNTDKKNIENAIRMASLSINVDDVMIVNDKIRNNEDKFKLSQSKEYHSLVSKLNDITTFMPIKSHWSYLCMPIDINELKLIYADKTFNGEDWTILSVLTIPMNDKDESTIPGYPFDTSKYPAMNEVLFGTKQITISDLVYDETYKNWNRAGFVRIYDKIGNFIAVLSVEVGIEHDQSNILSSLFLSSIYGLISSLVITLLFIRMRSKQ